jgi:hypothetical protein
MEDGALPIPDEGSQPVADLVSNRAKDPPSSLTNEPGYEERRDNPSILVLYESRHA